MSKFTKGKWEYAEYVPEGVTINGKEFIISADGDDIALARREDDARLIAAAPEMYEYFSAFLDLKNKARELLARIDGNSLKGGEA